MATKRVPYILKAPVQPELLLQAKVEQWSDDFELGLSEAIGMKLSNQQREFVHKLNDIYRAKVKLNLGGDCTPEELELAGKVGISIHSGRGLGKDYVISGIIPLFLLIFKEFKGILLANTQDQLEDVLSTEIRSRIRSAPIDLNALIGVNKNRVYLKGDKGDTGPFFGKRTVSIRADSDTAKASLGGYHDRYMLVVYDEASDMPRGVAGPLVGTLTGLANVAVLIGNPTRHNGYFWETHYNRTVADQWIQLRWNGEESDLNTLNPGLSTYIKSQAAYGTDSAAYRINVLGLPPLAEKDALIPIDWIWDAVEADIEPSGDMCLTIDPARGGDPAVILRRSGGFVYDEIPEFLSRDTTAIIRWAEQYIDDFDPEFIGIDSDGLGGPICDSFRRDGYSQIVEVSGSRSAFRPDRFENLRANLYWDLRVMFEKHLIRIPRDEKLIYELASIKVERWEPKILLKSKRQMRIDGVKSPNRADALAISMYHRTSSVNLKIEKDYEPDFVKARPFGWMAAR